MPMSMPIWIIWLAPLLALGVAAVSHNVRVSGTAACAGALISFAMAGVLVFHVCHASAITAIPHWVGVNAFGSVVVLIETFGGFTAALFAMGALSRHSSDAHAQRQFWIWFNLFLLALFAIPLLQEIALVWLALTLTTLFSVFLVSFDGDPAAFEAGWKYALMTTLGAAVAVLGILMLYWALATTGSTDFSWSGLIAAAPRLPPTILNLAFLLILIGFGAKAALIPFHAWLPDAYSRAPFPICAMLSILESAAIPYVLLQLAGIANLTPHSTANDWMLLFGLVSAGGAALLIIQTHEYKRLFAYSTIENAGIILTAGAAATLHAREAAIWQILAHGVTKPLIFFAAGTIFLLTQRLRLADIRGLLSRTRWGGATFMAAGLAIAGAPPFAIFLSELAVLKSTIESPRPWIGAVLALFMIISFCAITYHLFRMVLGEPAAVDARAQRALTLPKLCTAAIIIAAIPVIVLGWYIPGPIIHGIHTAGQMLGGSMP
jgi:hydrogenase-4 component F